MPVPWLKLWQLRDEAQTVADAIITFMQDKEEGDMAGEVAYAIASAVNDLSDKDVFEAANLQKIRQGVELIVERFEPLYQDGQEVEKVEKPASKARLRTGGRGKGVVDG